ncbi:AfsR/SARP family transcriptional regulator [Streptomyces griseoruber]|uniref:SARP family transcriptional regulator n=1 Tax=Streptomyces griseoruber TaxID=1943 RepID=A0A101SPZ5_9ACTN|nr:tetratricopeptide repeat protein [Streptomyces griseoruber]KUN78007.1 SARP family transcriptional regulator [Streptomyces griseoruber]
MEWEIRLSGSVEVPAAGRLRDLGSTKTRLALAALAWDAGRTVGMETLIHRIWDEHPPAKAREALHTHASRIRAALRVAGADAPTIVSRSHSYEMRVDPARVDLRRYTDLVHEARARQGDDETAALLLLDRADRLWRGEPLAGIAGSWAEHLRATVGETRLAAALTRADLLIGRGAFADAVPVLLPLVDAHPVDEALVERLAVALHGSSRTAEATRLLQRTRQRVIRDIGLDAGRRLHRVQQGILSGTSAADLLQRADRPPAPPAPPARRVPDNLPRDVPWVGRREELRRLTAALSESDGTGATVVTVEAVDGMGGVGKTSLAVHLAHRLRDRFPGGRLYLHLGGHAADRTALSPTRALTELLRLIGTDAKELPHDLEELVAVWRAAARERRMLVILDDAAGPDQVRPLLPGASPTAVVVTSRKRLPGLPGVRPVSLDVLPEDDAVALFERRLGARPDIRRTDVAEIVRICGFLPLAIEIAASRLLARPSWTTSDLLGQLTGGDGHLEELHDGERSVAHVFALSYRALNPVQRKVFRRCGLHFGTEFGPFAVAALTGLSVGAAERAMEELLARHLVSEPAPHRFTMHDLLRGYARSLVDDPDLDPDLDPDPESDPDPDLESMNADRKAVRKLVRHYLSVADRADRLAYPFRPRREVRTEAGPDGSPRQEIADAQAAERWLITEGANVLGALHWIADHGSERQLALSVHVLAGFLDNEGHVVTAEPLLRRAVAHWAAVGDEASRVRALLDLCMIHTHASRYEEAISAAREALEAARLLVDPALESECIHQLAIPLWQTGQYRMAQTLQKRALAFLLQTGSELQIARSRNLLGITHLHLAEHREALESFLSALAGFRAARNDRGKYSVLNNLAELYQRIGDPAAAEKAYREAIGIESGAGNKRDGATLKINLASVLDVLGKTGEALSLYEQALPVLRDMGDRRGEAIALNRIGRAYRAAGRGERAIERHLAALAVARRIHAAGEEAEVLYDLAQAERDTGQTARAVAHFEESLSISMRLGALSEQARASRALAQLRGAKSPGQ